MKEPKVVISKDEAVRRVRALRSKAPNAPEGLPKYPTNADDQDQIPGVWNNAGLSDPGYINWITGTGWGAEMY